MTDTMLADEGKYVHSEGDTNWWVPSGRVFFSDNPAQVGALDWRRRKHISSYHAAIAIVFTRVRPPQKRL